MQTNTVCQNRCKECITASIMADYPGYQMSMDQVRAFIQTLKESGYWIDQLHLNGLGEPTLWKHFNEAIPLLGSCGHIGHISVVTNGKSLHLVSKRAARYIHTFMLSAYPGPELVRINDALKEKGVPVLNMVRNCSAFSASC